MDVDPSLCSVSRSLEVLGDRWTILVLREIFNGVRRFDDIAQHIGVSRSVLARRLAALVANGILERRPYREPGERERHEYRLTEMGWDLQPVLISLVTFGDKHLAADGGPPTILTHADCGERVTAGLVCAAGHHVGDREVRMRPGPGVRSRSA